MSYQMIGDLLTLISQTEDLHLVSARLLALHYESKTKAIVFSTFVRMSSICMKSS